MDKIVILEKKEYEELKRKAEKWDRYVENETLEEDCLENKQTDFI